MIPEYVPGVFTTPAIYPWAFIVIVPGKGLLLGSSVNTYGMFTLYQGVPPEAVNVAE